MKRLEITYLETLGKSQRQLQILGESKLIKAGFDKNKDIVHSVDPITNNHVFTQKEDYDEKSN